jgi:radical SAM superfamily enzyme YgiQ (UPF0313 family)
MPDTFYAMRHFIDVIGKKAAYPPLGLLTIAPLLPPSWNKRLLDLNVTELTEQELDWADYVLLSAMNVQEESVREILKKCTAAAVPVVAGGPLFTHEHDRFPEVDHFVLNEAEITLPLFLQDLEAGSPKRIYQSDQFADITASPLPDYGLADMGQYIFSIVQYSRGCPYLCDFCDVTALFGRRPRIKTSEQMIRELEAIHALGTVKLILFADDNLIGNKKALKADLLPALIAWRKKVRPEFFFATQLTINLADDDELMDLLLNAGFRHIFIGIETPDEDGLKSSLKNQNLKRDQLRNIQKLHQAGFIISAGFIIGFDTDTATIFQRQIDFIQESGIPLPIVNILKAPPGTELYERIKREGRLSKPFAFSEGDTNIIPVMEEKLLYDGFLHIMENIYTPKRSYERIITFFKGYSIPTSTERIPVKYRMSELTIIFRIVFLLGVRYPGRSYFWQLILWCIINKPSLLDKSFFYSIMVYQMDQTHRHIKATVLQQNNSLFRTEAA